MSVLSKDGFQEGGWTNASAVGLQVPHSYFFILEEIAIKIALPVLGLLPTLLLLTPSPAYSQTPPYLQQNANLVQMMIVISHQVIAILLQTISHISPVPGMSPDTKNGQVKAALLKLRH